MKELLNNTFKKKVKLLFKGGKLSENEIISFF